MTPNEESGPFFRSFDPQTEVSITERNLPHWFQSGAAIFITFRTADSLPESVLLQWEQELGHWLTVNKLSPALAKSVAIGKSMQRNVMLESLNTSQRHELKRLSDRVFHRSLDECHGKCLLKRRELAEIVADALLFHNEKKYDLDRLVVMPNHVHAIAQFRTGATLDVVSQSWMRFSARRINAATRQTGNFWQSEPFDHIIRSSEQFEYFQQYIFENPKKANLHTGEFLYWERPK